MIEFTGGGEVSLEVNGLRLAVAQSYRTRTLRENRSVEAFGSNTPVGVMVGQISYQVELSRVVLLDETLGDGVSFHDLRGFTLTLARPGERVLFSGCEWTGIEESTSTGNLIAESMSLIAAERRVINA